MDTLKIILAFVIGIIVFAFIAGVIGDSGADFGALTVFIILGLFLGILMLSFFVTDKAVDGANKAKDVIVEKVSEKIVINQIRKLTNLELKKYNEARRSFQFFSSEVLITLFTANMQNDICPDIEQLALEEEMVKRGLLDHSPMHEKLYRLKKEFN